MNWSKLINYLIENHGLTYEKLGEELDVSFQTIYRLRRVQGVQPVWSTGNALIEYTAKKRKRKPCGIIKEFSQ